MSTGTTRKCVLMKTLHRQRGEKTSICSSSKPVMKNKSVGGNLEAARLNRRNQNVFSIHNRMLVGYLRCTTITVLAFMFGGIFGLFAFLLCAFSAKLLLEAINYIEHYGLVNVKREKPVGMRHSWNSNHLLSSVYLCNVTRHSDHHRSTALNFWELDPCHDDALSYRTDTCQCCIWYYLRHFCTRKLWQRNCPSGTKTLLQNTKEIII